MADQQLQRGDVVACAERYFVVWKVLTDAVVEAFPVRLDDEVISGQFSVDATRELSAWGIGGRRAAVCAGEREILVGARLPQVGRPESLIPRVGRCSGGLICRIVGQAARAYAAQVIADLGRGECNNNSGDSRLVLAAE